MLSLGHSISYDIIWKIVLVFYLDEVEIREAVDEQSSVLVG